MDFFKGEQIIMTERLEQLNGINPACFSMTDYFSSIPPGQSLTYNYTVQQNGTFWIHSHIGGQYPDGLRSAFIIKNPKCSILLNRVVVREALAGWNRTK